MSKRTLYGWMLLALVVLIFIFTKGDTTINLCGARISYYTSIVLMSFTGMGVAIGVLLR
jgi:hypothetical protein